jgi:hypothetical protein
MMNLMSLSYSGSAFGARRVRAHARLFHAQVAPQQITVQRNVPALVERIASGKEAGFAHCPEGTALAAGEPRGKLVRGERPI